MFTLLGNVLRSLSMTNIWNFSIVVNGFGIFGNINKEN